MDGTEIYYIIIYDNYILAVCTVFFLRTVFIQCLKEILYIYGTLEFFCNDGIGDRCGQFLEFIRRAYDK